MSSLHDDDDDSRQVILSPLCAKTARMLPANRADVKNVVSATATTSGQGFASAQRSLAAAQSTRDWRIFTVCLFV